MKLATSLAALALGWAAGCQGSVGSVGAVLGRDKSSYALVVRGVAEGQAAHRAGLEPGDEVLFVDGTYARDLSADEVRALLRGEVGSAVDVTVARPNGEIRWLRIVRTQLGLPNAKLIEKPGEPEAAQAAP